jgi:DNA modification methylase
LYVIAPVYLKRTEWALRDYGVEGQLGLEPTFEEFIDKLCNIYDEVKRVLKKTGTCWVNLGDTYASSSKGSGGTGDQGDNVYARLKARAGFSSRQTKTTLPDKTLCMIPFRFAIEMVNRGWILRNTLIWHKPNCMPSSAKDRFTVDFEYVFFFSKNTQYENLAVSSKKRLSQNIEQQQGSLRAHGGAKVNGPIKACATKRVVGAPGQNPHSFERKGHSGYYDGEGNPLFNTQGRNKRCVWSICPQPFSEAHFAVFPEELVETPIKAEVWEIEGEGISTK